MMVAALFSVPPPMYFPSVPDRVIVPELVRVPASAPPVQVIAPWLLREPATVPAVH